MKKGGIYYRCEMKEMLISGKINEMNNRVDEKCQKKLQKVSW